MKKQLCYEQLPEEYKKNNAWKCDCVWRSGARSVNPDCKIYNDCMAKQRAGQEGKVTKVLKNVEKAIFLTGGSGGNSLLSSEAKLVTKRDPIFVKDAQCVDPLTIKLEQITCQCFDTYHDVCVTKDGDAQVQCWRDVMCGHEEVCQSWQDKSCTADEKSRGAAMALIDNKETRRQAQRANTTMTEGSQAKKDSEQVGSLDDSLSGKRTC